MFNIGMPELMLIFFVALIVVGPKRLPELGRSIGKAMAALKKASFDIKQALEQQVPQELEDEVRQKLEKNEQE